MKAILEFDLPEDVEEHKLAVNASNMYSVLWDLDQFLRKVVKYQDEDTPELHIDTCQTVRDKLYEIMGEYNIKFD